MAKGTISARVEARKRKLYPVDLADALKLDGPAPVLVRISQKAEDDKAIIQAFSYIEQLTKTLGPEASAAARLDTDLLSDSKAKEALIAVFRDAEDPSKPAFPSGDWIGINLSIDEIASLTNVYAEVRRVDAMLPVPDATGVSIILNALANLAEQGNQTPGTILSPYGRDVVVYVLVEAAVERQGHLRRIADLEEQLAGLDEEAPPSTAPEPGAAGAALGAEQDEDDEGPPSDPEAPQAAPQD